MLHYKKIAVALSLVAFMLIGMAATRPLDDKKPKMNLKVLPKNISHEDLMKTMDAWKTALGVKCVEQDAEEPSPRIGPGLKLMKVLPGQQQAILHEVFSGPRI